MEYRTLGRTGLDVSVLSMGGLFVSKIGGGREQARAAVHRALELGVNYVDTAPGYLDSEEVLGEALEDVTRPYILSTKLGGRPQPFAAQALAEPGKQYTIYLYRPGGPVPGASVEFSPDMPRGRYQVEWVNPTTGAIESEEQVQHLGGERTLSSPPFAKDVALRVVGRG